MGVWKCIRTLAFCTRGVSLISQYLVLVRPDFIIVMRIVIACVDGKVHGFDGTSASIGNLYLSHKTKEV
jgi:hypothetical protein